MQTQFPLILLAAAAALGLLLATQFLRRVRSSPYVIASHLILGAAALESMVTLISGAPDGSPAPSGGNGRIAAGLLAGAIFVGLMIPLLGKRSRATATAMVAVHVSLAGGGALLATAWLLHR